jgi:hypothetical protein
MTAHVDDFPVRGKAEVKLGVEYAKECFELRGSEVYWRSRPVRHFSSEHAWKVFQTKYAGKPAGRKELSGYISINIRHKGARLQFQAHRVIWMLHYGSWPQKVIDHINRDRSDNRIENLRDVDVSVNVQNKVNGKSSGHKGSMKSRTKFMSHVRVGPKYVYLGIFERESDAQEYHRQATATLTAYAEKLRKPASIGRPRKQA